MVQITKENGMQHAGVPFAWVEVQYPDKVQWDEAGFYDMVERHLAALREQYRDYVRADVFGQNPYFRYFRKFKKTYPVMMQFESVLLKGREFPRWNAVTAVPFLVELETHVLCGTHDIVRLMGPVELYQAEAREPFAGLRGDEVHTYPGDETETLHGLDLEIAEGSFVAVLGHNGSGKSTLTHAKHGGKYEIKVLHDDAFIINTDTCSSIAIEPTYFDKTADYPTGCADNKFLLTAQNCSATMDEDGKIQLVTEDIRNGNGRAIKSKLWSPNRVDKINAPVNAIFWIMKDPTIPPVVKLKGASLASVMGATLATKRSSAERLAPGVDPNKLVVVPYANPFRTYPLANDYEKFKKLVEEKHVDCYIVNTGDFMGKKVQKEDTLGILEAIVEKRADFHQWGPFSDIEIMDWEGFVPDMQDKNYTDQLKARMNDRVNEIKAFATEKEGYNKLPDDALAAIQKVVDELK